MSLRIRLCDPQPNDDTVVDAIRKLVTQLQLADPTTVIYPWLDQQAQLAPITSTSNVPTSVPRLRAYFPRITHHTKTEDIHTTLRLGSAVRQDTIRERLSSWLSSNKFGLWPCPLQQCEQTTGLGWLLYSTRELDLQVLTTAIQLQTKCDLGLQWRPIATGKQALESNVDRTRAVHIEVASEHYHFANNILRTMYSASSAGLFPNGVHLRLVPEIGPHMTTMLHAKVDRLRLRQAHFLNTVIKIPNWEIEALKFPDPSIQKSLRETLLEIKSKERPNLPLFHSVDHSWNGNGHIFSVLPLVEDKARTVIAGLLPYLRATLPSTSQPDHYFTPSAVSRANEVTWNVSHHGLITGNDLFVQAILTEDDGFELGPALETHIPAQTSTTVLHHDSRDNGRNSLGGETDSVSTLQSVCPTPARLTTSIAWAVSGIGGSNPGRQPSPPNSTISSLTVKEQLLSTETKLEICYQREPTSFVSPIDKALRLISRRLETFESRTSLPTPRVVLARVSSSDSGQGLCAASPLALSQSSSHTTPSQATSIKQQLGRTSIRALGRPIRYRRTSTMRILIHNINGLPSHNAHPKNVQVRAALLQYNVDLLLASEINVNWSKVSFQQRLSERFCGWWEASYIQVAYNVHDLDADPVQYGGVALLAIKSVAHRVRTSGVDPSGLGRLCWVLIPGKAGVRTRFMTAYRPVRNPTGPTSVFNQHVHHFLATHQPGCPRERFYLDLRDAIQHWLAEGDQLVLGLDLNEDLWYSSFMKQITALGLIELNLTRHGLSTPATHSRGSKPIDALFVTTNFCHATCGFLAFGEAVPSDHRPIWVDLPYSMVFGHHPPPMSKPQMRRLQCTNPRTVSNYNSRLLAILQSHRIPQRVEQLQAAISFPITTEHVAEWEEIDKVRVQAIQQAEHFCRKLRTGQVPWSPTLQRAIDRVSYWGLVLKSMQKGRVSSKLLTRLRKKAQVDQMRSTVNHATNQLSIACQEYTAVKKQAETLCGTWIKELAQMLATVQGGLVDHHNKALYARERVRIESRACHKAVGKVRPMQLVSVVAPTQTGEWVEMTMKTAIERSCLAENLARIQQASQSPFLQPPLQLLIDPLASNVFAKEIRDGTFQCPRALNQYNKAVIQALAHPSEAAQNPISSDLTIKEYRARWLRAREYTATGHSGLHFGHFKASANHPMLLQIDLTMALLPAKYGFSPMRWRVGHNVALLKNGKLQGQFLKNNTLA